MSKIGIAVYKDFTIESNDGDLSDVRQYFLNETSELWKHNQDQENKLKKRGRNGGEDLIIFDYIGDLLPKASLALWQNDNAYKITNIVPKEMSDLGIDGYNSLLDDFVTTFSLTEKNANFKLTVTDGIRTLDSWVPENVVTALERFSTIAFDKSPVLPEAVTFWELFVIRVHQSDSILPYDVLQKWLESDGWRKSSASKFVRDFANGIELLEAYDRVRES